MSLEHLLLSRDPSKSITLSLSSVHILHNLFPPACEVDIRSSGSEAGSYLRLIDFVYHSTLGLRVIKKKREDIRSVSSGENPWSRIWNLGFGIRVWGLGCRDKGSGFEV